MVEMSFQSSLRDYRGENVPLPSDESLGYYQTSLRDGKPRRGLVINEKGVALGYHIAPLQD